ncbi:T9SS type A sorting domain-containing protein [Plebeiibacterium marinum]|uniref:T9SS type A sorting domain-containing protein n=1 Tax=Plebeiibacterium marinum TaxID=2992111 RepID=A0AAE3MFV0_9BACT|nr:T9SS type A sorting domain-containing protein [Plebeiobacterium marinum]MCW3806671.1 T9SS type A sorting domain-containing protein [Plebeiobacterium marinum]
MQKKFFILIVAVSLIGIYFFADLQISQKERKKVLSVSSEDIIQQQIDRKIERRKNGYAKPADKPDKYVEYKQAMKSGFGKLEYPKNYKAKELKAAIAHKSSLKRTTEDLPWVQRGPGNIGGRTRAIVVDHSDATQQTWFAGAVSGGIWKTSDAGSNWELVSPDITNMSINSMAMAPSNANVIYAGTGEGYYNLDAVQGNGMYKSVDNGVTWSQIAKTTNTSFFHYVNDIVVSPSDENILYVATNRAVTKSYDGGDNWSNITPQQGGDGRYQRLIMHPSDENILWVTLNNKGVLKSTDAGASWFQVLDISGEGRIELMVSKVDADMLYALNQDSKLYYSNNGGEDWAECVEGSTTNFLGGQGWYNNVIAGHPTDENKGFIGGIDCYSFTLGSDISGSGKLAYSLVNGMSSLIETGNFYGTHENGGLKIYDAYSGITDDIEIQFGSGLTQKAHRLNSTSYTYDISTDLPSLEYNNFIDVPFKVIRTDGTINTQLDASFIDSNDNGIFDLTAAGYEVIIIHGYSYSGVANTSVVENNGNSSVMVALYPKLVDSAVWDEASLPTSNIEITPFNLYNRSLSTDHLTVWHTSGASNYSHADHHNITILDGVGSPFSILVGNDGGLFYSSDAGINWSTKSQGYITTQFYGIARHPEQNIYFGGMQDNGSYISSANPSVSSDWDEVLGGDGFDVVWHSRNPDKIIGSIYYNDLSRSSDGGATWEDIHNNIGDNTEETAPFLTKIASSKINPDLLFVAGKSGLWRSENFGTNWENISIGSDWGWGGGGYPKMAISEANPDVVWAGIIMNSDGTGGYTTGTMHVSTDGGGTFSSAVNAMDLGAVSNIVTHPNDANTAYLLFSYSNWPKIFKTTDLGQTWEDISGFHTTDGEGNVIYGADYSFSGFPNVAVNTMLVMPFDENELWVGTEIGLFISYDGGGSWALANNGIPAVSIWDMKIVGDEIVVGTHGLGVWTVQRSGLSTVDYNPYLNGIGVNPNGNYTLEVDCNVAYDKLELYVDEELMETYSGVEVGIHQYVIDANMLEGKQRVRVLGYVESDSYSSNSLDIPESQLLAVRTSYSNTFSEDLDDFYGNGFAINGNGLNNNNAIVTDHPYPENTDLYYTLKYPITVSGEQAMAFIKYQDIAYVETGEDGIEYPDTDFYDYVVVQASKDGINWVDLAPGYDFNYNNVWNSGGSQYSDTPTYADYADHTIDLWDSFNAGDVIIVRFKLHSDPYTVGWGWAIDNLRIQEDISSIFSNKGYDFSLDIYPNPSKGNINIEVEETYVGMVNIIVYTISGNKVAEYSEYKESRIFNKNISLDHLSKGSYIVKVEMGKKQSSEVLVIK